MCNIYCICNAEKNELFLILNLSFFLSLMLQQKNEERARKLEGIDLGERDGGGRNIKAHKNWP